MKKHQTLTTAFSTLVVLSGALACGTASAGPRVGSIVGTPSSNTATVQARVLSATPVVAQVEVPRPVCFDELRQAPVRSSGGGALLGAIAGGVIGNALGKGGGRALATGAGVIGGAILGDHIENDGRQGGTRTVRQCEQQVSYQNQVVAYDVVYEYAGQRYSTQMPQEPGKTIPLQVMLSPQVYSAPPMVMQAPAVSRADYYQPDQQEVIMIDAPLRDWDDDRRWERDHHHRRHHWD
ncbi:MAG: glycine zipper 2TM domain-containing protein [Pseudomonadota bacterium]